MKEKGIKNTFSQASNWILQGNNRVKIFFLLLSVLLWFLIKLSKTGYVSTISFPVEYSQMPEDKILMNDPPKSIKLQMQANGFTLLKHTLWSYKELKVALRTVRMAPNGKYYWLPDRDLRDLESQLSDDATVIDISPDSVFFDFSPLQTRSIPVKPAVKLAKNGAISLYKKPHVSPTKIEVSGPPEMLDRIDTILTKTFRVPVQAQDSLSATVDLALPDMKNVKFSHRKVKLNIQLTKLTEETSEVNIDIINVPDSLKLELYPSKVELTYRVALRDFQKVQEEKFRVVADFHELEENPQSRYLNLRVENAPDIIRQIDLDPKRVEFIKTKQ